MRPNCTRSAANENANIDFVGGEVMHGSERATDTKRPEEDSRAGRRRYPRRPDSGVAGTHRGRAAASATGGRTFGCASTLTSSAARARGRSSPPCSPSAKRWPRSWSSTSSSAARSSGRRRSRMGGALQEQAFGSRAGAHIRRHHPRRPGDLDRLVHRHQARRHRQYLAADQPPREALSTKKTGTSSCAMPFEPAQRRRSSSSLSRSISVGARSAPLSTAASAWPITRPSSFSSSRPCAVFPSAGRPGRTSCYSSRSAPEPGRSATSP